MFFVDQEVKPTIGDTEPGEGVRRTLGQTKPVVAPRIHVIRFKYRSTDPVLLSRVARRPVELGRESVRLPTEIVVFPTLIC